MDERCQLTVVGARRRVDLAVPAHAPIAEYVPALLRLCGQDEDDDTFPSAWSLAPAGAPAIAPWSSLAEAGVLDGATLYLRDSAAGETDEPVVRDLEDMVGAVGAPDGLWNASRRAWTLVVAGLLALVAGACVLAATRSGEPVAGPVSAAAGLGLALLAGHAARKGWPVPSGVRLVQALSAVPLLGAAGYALPPARGGAAAAAVAVCVLTLLGALVARLAVPHAATLTVLAGAALALPLSVVLLVLHASPAEAAALTALLFLGVRAVAPTAAGYLAALAAPAPDDTASPEEIPALVLRGHRVLAVLALLCSLVISACLLVLGAADNPFALTLALALSLALLLGASQLRPAAAVVPLVLAGALGLSVLLLQVPGRLGAPHWTGPACLAAAGLACVARGLGAAFGGRDETEARERPVWAASMALSLSLACVPLTVGVFGVFGYLFGLGRSM
ncbi:type VII secretion integral membrane protein EccD [Streptomyces sp. NPDC001380]|uniref:type VII secretion integral membrane protein EccD n=1 Tax=Streptomyces sp. NPDC001380 TaxID=3364566 RepID=UPI00369C4A08